MLYMDFLFTLAIFIIILFLYIYIANQYKKSEDLDIYETDFSDNTQLQGSMRYFANQSFSNSKTFILKYLVR